MPSRANLKQLLEEVNTLPRTDEGDYIAMAFCQSAGLPAPVAALPGVMIAIKELALLRNRPVVNVMVNWLKPGKETPKHRDYLKPTPLQPTLHPRIERWHLPIQTNDKCIWWDEHAGCVDVKPGFWHGPVPYWILHSVANLGTEPRIHLIVDLDTPNPVGEYSG